MPCVFEIVPGRDFSDHWILGRAIDARAFLFQWDPCFFDGNGTRCNLVVVRKLMYPLSNGYGLGWVQVLDREAAEDVYIALTMLQTNTAFHQAVSRLTVHLAAGHRSEQ
jgi:hypothetical protein